MRKNGLTFWQKRIKHGNETVKNDNVKAKKAKKTENIGDKEDVSKMFSCLIINKILK